MIVSVNQGAGPSEAGETNRSKDNLVRWRTSVNVPEPETSCGAPNHGPAERPNIAVSATPLDPAI